MNCQKLITFKQFLKPDWKKLVVFAVFMFIAYAGYIQTWGFSGKESGVPKPLFYDLLKPIPFWVIWMYLLVPVFILTGGTFNWIPSWLSGIINLIYFYVLSCLMIFVWDKLRRRK